MADNADGKVLYKVEIDDSSTSTDLDNANKKIEQATEKTEKKRQQDYKETTQEFKQQSNKMVQENKNSNSNMNNDIQSTFSKIKDSIGNAFSGIKDKLSDNADTISSTFDGVAGDVGTSFSSLAQGGIIASLSAISVAAVSTASDLDGAMQKFQATTGVADEELGQYEETLKSIYQNNYGESFDDIAGAMSNITQQMGDLNQQDLQNVTEGVLTLRDTFDMDMNESLRGVNQLMTQFGIDSQTALDLMASGAQNGLNYTDELGDNVSEYAGKFAQAGYSAEEYFQLLENGTQNGSYNLDKVNDAINEVTTRLADGTIKDSLSSFSKETQKTFKAWEKGDATQKDVIDRIVEDIKNCTNEQDKMTLASTAFGTMGEDANTKFVESLTSVGDTFNDVGGTMDEVKDTMSEGLGNQLQELWRNIQMIIEPLGSALLPIINAIVSVISTIFGILSPVFEIIGDIITSVTDFFASINWQEVIDEQLENIKQAFENVKEKIGEFLSWAGEKWEEFKQFWADLWENIKTALSEQWENIKTSFSNAVQSIVDWFKETWDNVKQWFSDLWTGIKDNLSTAIDNIKTALENGFNNAIDRVKTAFTNFKDWIGSIWESIKTIFQGVIDFITGIFTGNWSRAWDGVKSVFKGIIDGIKNIFKTPINWIIDGINKFIGGINKIKIPDWVPGVGGLGFSIPKIPRLKVGMDFVPNDYFPAFLDYGEAVLTKEENAKLRSLGGLNNIENMMNQSFNNEFSFDYDKLSKSLARLGLYVKMDSKVVGQLVSDSVDQSLGTTTIRKGRYGI